MAGFGDVLRGLGSVLNPQVNQDVEGEYQKRIAQQQQMQQFALGQLVKGVESGAVDPSKLPPQLQGIVGVSPEAQARMDALKNEQGYRAALSGLDPNAPDYNDRALAAASRFGKPEIVLAATKAKEDREARVKQAQDALDLKRQIADQTHELRLAAAKGDEEKRAEIARHNAVVEGLQRDSNSLRAVLGQMGLSIQRDKVDAVKGQQTQKQVTQLGAALEKANLPEADAVIGKVEEILSKRPDVADYLSGPKSVIPDFALPADITEGKQAFQKLFNITLKNRSGAAVTNQELERLKSEFGAGVFKTAQQLRQAVEQARSIINKHYASVAAGFGPDALKEYNDNAKAIGARVVLGEQVAPPAATPQQNASDGPPPGAVRRKK